LEKVNEAVDEIEAVVEIEKGTQRYGNKSFRTLIERVKIIYDSGTFLGNLFINSFGDQTRIDYGTGHELSFIIFLLCSISIDDTETEKIVDYAWIGGYLIGQKYLSLVRKIQCKYSLEQAGSHGVWGLDDHQFIPFLLGSSQLIIDENENDYNLTNFAFPLSSVSITPKRIGLPSL
jgi:serine/threonine-protein phosphatase 2A activator